VSVYQVFPLKDVSEENKSVTLVYSATTRSSMIMFRVIQFTPDDPCLSLVYIIIITMHCILCSWKNDKNANDKLPSHLSQICQ